MLTIDKAVKDYDQGLIPSNQMYTIAMQDIVRLYKRLESLEKQVKAKEFKIASLELQTIPERIHLC